MATQLVTPEVAIDRIVVINGFNARKSMDRAELKALAQTMKDTGLVQPIAVRPGKRKGRYELVAGHRRLEAAKIAGFKKVKVTVSEGNPYAEAFVENNHRADLNPIERALGLRALAEESGLTTNKKIAAKARKSEQWVGDHLRLLNLPEEVQAYIAAGDVPMAAESLLRPIAEVSAGVAVAICQIGREREYSTQQFLDRFGELFTAAGEAELEGKPTMIGAPRLFLSEVLPDLNPKKKEHAQLIGRINEVFSNYHKDDPVVELAEAEIDAARAAGCLVEYQGRWGSPLRYILDRELAADLIERAIERRHKETLEDAEAEAAAKVKRREERKKSRKEREAKGELSPQAQAKADAELARRYNDDLGRKLLERRTGGKSKKHALARAKAIAHLLVGDNPELAGRGLRFTLPTLQDVEVKKLKSGRTQEKVTYATNEECTAELRRRIDGARTETEVNEVLTEALLAALLADNKAEPRSRRPRWYPSTNLDNALKAEIKEVRPRKPRRPKGRTV